MSKSEEPVYNDLSNNLEENTFEENHYDENPSFVLSHQDHYSDGILLGIIFLYYKYLRTIFI